MSTYEKQYNINTLLIDNNSKSIIVNASEWVKLDTGKDVRVDSYEKILPEDIFHTLFALPVTCYFSETESVGDTLGGLISVLVSTFFSIHIEDWELNERELQLYKDITTNFLSAKLAEKVTEEVIDVQEEEI